MTTVGQSGWTANNGLVTQSRTMSYANSARSWGYFPPTWIPVKNDGTSVVGCFYTVELQRNSSTWDVTLTNNLT